MSQVSDERIAEIEAANRPGLGLTHTHACELLTERATLKKEVERLEGELERHKASTLVGILKKRITEYKQEIAALKKGVERLEGMALDTDHLWAVIMGRLLNDYEGSEITEELLQRVCSGVPCRDEATEANLASQINTLHDDYCEVENARDDAEAKIGKVREWAESSEGSDQYVRAKIDVEKMINRRAILDEKERK